MTTFWVLLLIANGFTLLGCVTGRLLPYVGSFICISAAVMNLTLGGAA